MFSVGDTVECVNGGYGVVRGMRYTIREMDGAYCYVDKREACNLVSRFKLVNRAPARKGTYDQRVKAMEFALHSHAFLTHEQILEFLVG